MHKVRKLNIFFLIILLLISLVPVSFVYADSQDTMSEQQGLSKQINSNRSTIVDLQNDIQNLNSKIKEAQTSAAGEARVIQVSNVTDSMINEIFSARNLTDFVQRIVSINMVVSATNKQAVMLQKTQKEKKQALNKMTTAQAQLEQQQQKLRASIDTYNVTEINNLQPVFIPESQSSSVMSSSSGTGALGISGISVSEAQARANIVARESSGNYQIKNGRYYGAYQLDIGYLNGNLSSANQDAAAQAYVTSRYGSWANAWIFWQTHGYY